MLLMAPRVAGQLIGDRQGSAMGRRPTMVRFRARDRRLFVAALHRKWFERLCQIIGAPELAQESRFADQRSQAKNADALIDAIEARLATRSAAEWEAEFVHAGRSRNRRRRRLSVRARSTALPGPGAATGGARRKSSRN